MDEKYALVFEGVLIISLILLIFFNVRTKNFKKEKLELQDEIGRFEQFIPKYILCNIGNEETERVFLKIVQAFLRDEKLPKNFLRSLCTMPSSYKLMKSVISLEIDSLSYVIANRKCAQDDMKDNFEKQKRLRNLLTDLESARISHVGTIINYKIEEIQK